MLKVRDGGCFFVVHFVGLGDVGSVESVAFLLESHLDEGLGHAVSREVKLIL